MTRILAVCGIVLLTSACAGQTGVTPYGPMSIQGGYHEEEVEPGLWRILARSSSKAGTGYARNMAEYRAGELLKARGFSHVQMLAQIGRWELGADLGRGERRVVGDQMALTVRGAHDGSPPSDCRTSNRSACYTERTDTMMDGARPYLAFSKGRARQRKP